jgi:hypothetical protein
VVQDDDCGLVLQSTVGGHTIIVDPQIMSQFIGVPVLQILGSPYNEVVIPPSLDDLKEFFHAIPQGEERATTIRIGALSAPHRMLAKIVQHNLWPVIRCNDLILKRAQYVYAISLRLPFCLCKHILGIILEARDEGNTGLPFGCLLTQIILQSGISIAGESTMKIQDLINKHTLMKSNAQLWRDDQDDDVPPPPPIPVGIPDVASSSQTVPPPQQDASYSQIMEALATIQGGMSSIQLSMSSMQQEVHSINLCVEKNQLDLWECLKFHHPSSSDDEDDAPMADAL